MNGAYVYDKLMSECGRILLLFFYKNATYGGSRLKNVITSRCTTEFFHKYRQIFEQY